MLWHQLFDEPLTEENDDNIKYYEGYLCSVRNSELARSTSLTGRID